MSRSSSETVVIVRSSQTKKAPLFPLHQRALITSVDCSQWRPSLPWHLTLSSLIKMQAPFADPLFLCGVDVQD